ncbi:uncharacterized protein LOC126549288 isoform X2 [Aphis gossypii]|uniref:uncharacterized protein LOC126549288 isoform X2 n=1 Tax=Aphis gossypii TaxID=80765 RepID=UPI0021598211|nr:uncharacterized protein LOC126549288 isoform X2 [Aphis gossypii]
MGRAAYKCCVIGCTSKGVSSHRFPNPRTFFEMFQKWLTTLGSERFENIQHRVIYEKFRICSLHFSINDFSPGTKTLKHNVLPHLMMFKPVPTNVNNVISPIVNVEQSVLTQDLNQLESASASNVSPNIGNAVSVFNDDLNISGIGILNDSEIQHLNHTSSLYCANSECNSSELICILHKIGVTRANKLTPKCKSLYANAKRLQKQLQREHKKCSTFKQRLEAASNHMNCQTSQQMTTAAKIFTRLQLRESKMKPKGRRFTLNEKLMSLSLYKQSPKSYRLLAKMFVLPCRKTLTNMLTSVPINTGIDPTLIKVLKENVKSLKPQHRFCSILFDEVSLSASLHYNSNEGIIYGFEENNSGRTQQFADHSLVFMVRGIVKNFKQPICYTFCKSTTNKND